jgi:hypothetical protein
MNNDPHLGNRMLRGTIVSTLALVPAVAANAQEERSAQISTTMEVSVPPCVVTGSTVDLGTYFVGQTAADVAERNGTINDALVFENPSNHSPQVIGTIRCPVAVNWDVSVIGESTAAGGRNFIDLVNSASPGSPPLVVVPYYTYTNPPGSPVPGTFNSPIHAGAGGMTASGVGTGNDQPIEGGYVVYQDGATDPELVQGDYTNSATTLSVSFIPQVNILNSVC